MEKRLPIIAYRPPDSLEQGQILLVVVLLMVIVLTIGLSLATRSVTNLRQATEEDNSQRAFSAAEAGVQVALKTGAFAQKNFSTSTQYSAKIVPISGQEVSINQGKIIPRN